MAIPKSEVVDYWARRSEAQGARTVGFNNTPLEDQDRRYKKRHDFIFPFLDPKKTTLDYGCGIGRYTHFFEKSNYIGADITTKLLDIARSSYPNYNFLKIENVGDVPDLSFDVFFTATVLQHNADETVRLIFKNLQKIKNTNIQFVLYENDQTECSHVQRRTPHEYLDMVSDFFKVTNFECDSHVIHGEKHSLAKIDT